VHTPFSELCLLPILSRGKSRGKTAGGSLDLSQPPRPASRIKRAYLKNNWEALLLFTTDGRLPIDNNETEHLMEQIAPGRKNWLHVGSLAAGHRAANLMTIISTRRRGL